MVSPEVKIKLPGLVSRCTTVGTISVRISSRRLSFLAKKSNPCTLATHAADRPEFVEDAVPAEPMHVSDVRNAGWALHEEGVDLVPPEGTGVVGAVKPQRIEYHRRLEAVACPEASRVPPVSPIQRVGRRAVPD